MWDFLWYNILTKGEIMEVKESDFDVVLSGNGTKEDFLKVLEDSANSLYEQIKILHDGIKLAQSEKSLELKKEPYNMEK